MDAQRMESIRETVARALDDLGMPEAPFSLTVETSRHRDRDHITRASRGEGVRAVWLVPLRALELFGEDGSLLTRVSLASFRFSCREAA